MYNSKSSYQTNFQNLSLNETVSDRIINEFKSQTLPKLRLKRLIKLQALIRGFLCRKVFIPRLRIRNKALEQLASQLIDKTITNNIVPDLVLDVISNSQMNNDFSLYSEDYRIFYEIQGSILERVLRAMCRQIAMTATDNIVNEILHVIKQKEPDYGNDPMVYLAEDMILKKLRPECKIIAKQAIQEVTNEYILEQHYLKKSIQKQVNYEIKEVVQESIYEVLIENYIENMISKLSYDYSLIAVQKMMEEFELDQEKDELENAFDSFLQRKIINSCIDEILQVMISEQQLQNQIQFEDKHNQLINQIQKEQQN